MIGKSKLNEIRLGYSYYHRWVNSIGHPRIMAIETTNACGLRCIMCPRNYMTRKVGFMKLDLFKKIIDQIKDYNDFVWLHLFGDPLLDRNIGEIIKYTEQAGIQSGISTNPIMLNEKAISTMMDNGLSRLVLSIDGTSAQTHNAIRVNSDYEKAMRNLRNFIDIKVKASLKKPQLILSFVTMDINKNEADEFRKMWSIEGIDQLWIKKMYTWNNEYEEINKLLDEKEYRKEHFMDPRLPCSEPWNQLTILWDGRVVPCCYDHDGKIILGDLNRQSIKEIWNGKEIKKLRRQLLTRRFDGNTLCAPCKERWGCANSNRIYPLDLLFNSIKRKVAIPIPKYNS